MAEATGKADKAGSAEQVIWDALTQWADCEYVRGYVEGWNELSGGAS
jgi:hypothetical protein